MADPGSGYSSGAFSGMGGGGLSETEIDRDIGRQMALGPTREFDASAWYGEDETYGTQGDWLTGEGLTTRWGEPTSAYPSYANPLVEGIATNPAANMLVNAEGMLKRGGGPGPWDYAALGLSAIPGGSWALRTARPYVKNLFRSKTPNVDDYVPDYVLRGREFGRNALKDLETSTGLPPQTRESMLAKLDQQRALAMDVRTMPIDEFLAMDVRIQDRLLANANLSRRDIQLVHFVNSERLANEKLVVQLENVGTPEFTEMAKTLRANIKEVDEVIKNLSVAEQKRIGIYDKYGLDALKVWRENQTKVALKPGHIGMSDMEWATLVQGKTLSEVKDIARKLTLRVVD